MLYYVALGIHSCSYVLTHRPVQHIPMWQIGDNQGRIQDFKLVGAHLKNLRRAEGGANIFGVFRVKNHIFSNFRGGGARAGSAPDNLLIRIVMLYIRPAWLIIVMLEGVPLLSY